MFFTDLSPRKPASPYTGMQASPKPVLAVKLDNHRDARPHVGLEKADIVFVEQVEGGLSRLMAVYASTVPGEIGPVRSAREHQVEQLAMFRRPAFAYSGAQEGVEQAIKGSPLWARSHDAFPDAYGRDTARPAPHNLLLTPDVLLKDVPDADVPTDIGWRFGKAPDGGTPTTAYTVNYPAAKVEFEWVWDQARYTVAFDGVPAKDAKGRRLGPRTVVVQRVEMPPSRYQDRTRTTPYMATVGEGAALVLRDGKAYETYWERPCPEAGTGFWLKEGEGRMPFARGQVWVVYEEAPGA